MLSSALRTQDAAPVRTGPRKLPTGPNPYLEAPARIMSFREKFFAMRDLGVDRLLRVQFKGFG